MKLCRNWLAKMIDSQVSELKPHVDILRIPSYGNPEGDDRTVPWSQGMKVNASKTVVEKYWNDKLTNCQGAIIDTEITVVWNVLTQVAALAALDYGQNKCW